MEQLKKEAKRKPMFSGQGGLLKLASKAKGRKGALDSIAEKLGEMAEEAAGNMAYGTLKWYNLIHPCGRQHNSRREDGEDSGEAGEDSGEDSFYSDSVILRKPTLIFGVSCGRRGWRGWRRCF